MALLADEAGDVEGAAAQSDAVRRSSPSSSSSAPPAAPDGGVGWCGSPRRTTVVRPALVARAEPCSNPSSAGSAFWMS